MSPLMAVILTIAAIESKGASGKPVVSFSPNWATILTYESITLTCDVGSPAQRDQRFTWYRNHRSLNINEQSYTVKYAEQEHIGDYQCRAGTGDISEAVRLEVSGAHVILQAPPMVFEGDTLSLRCHSYDKYPASETKFYKDHKEIKSLGTASEFLMGKVNAEMSGLYKCSRRIMYHSSLHNYSDQVDISMQELFSSPQIKVRPDQVTEGDHMTITCDTKLNPRRATTELQFAFYRNGHNVQGFSLSNQYGVPSVQLEDSGNYICEVQTPTGSVRKRSTGVQMQLYGAARIYWIIIGLSLLSILLIGAALTYKYRHSLALPLLCNCLRHHKQGSDSSTALVRLPNEEMGGPEAENLRASEEFPEYGNLPLRAAATEEEDVCYSHINSGQLHRVFSSATYRPDDCSVIYCVVKPTEPWENTSAQVSVC
ncbi:hypothetical protein XENTR_v10022646 [Xenopus tropicalis]|uniref:Fc receptor, IgG, high affinity I isoform X1 n=2 Tax=Xenopus tropicalis TaxID=8364 RepID=A0A8J1ILE4_XENTR|nr:Fc receptor, IgG, high affinity I isoform X1 [Xenopus tropicalis]KAE8588628.1 hypothetical protein XENTR_v10022646 [Xenopus tropicalis]